MDGKAVVLIQQPTVSRQRRWQLRKKAAGMCTRCGKFRGTTGTATHCKVCHVKVHANEVAKRKRTTASKKS